MNKRLLHVLLSIGCFFGLILFFTHGLFNNFFEQDEWGAIGVTIHSALLPWWNIFISRGYHFSPIGYVLWLALYRFFGLHAEYYTFVQLLMHAAASYLVYSLSSRLSRDKKVGLLTGILFATNGRAYQAFMHLAINTTVGVFIFIMLFFVYLHTIKNKLFTAAQVISLFIIFLTAVSIREEGVLIVPMFIIYLLVFDRIRLNRQNVKPFFYLGIGFFTFVGFRYISQRLNVDYIPTQMQASYGSVLYNFGTLPIKLVVQNIISGVNIFKYLVANGSQIYSDTQISVLGAYPVFMDLAFAVIFIFMLTAYGIWLLICKSRAIIKLLLFCIFWLISNAFILAFVGRRLYIVEERYLYVSSFPVLLLISVFIISLFRVRVKNVYTQLLCKLISVSIILVLLTTSYFEIQDAVKYKSFNGKARKSLLASIVAVHPTIPEKTIFYFQCKGVCHHNELFGLSSAWVLPFSSGPGWNILVLYCQKQEAIWGKFLTDDYLLNLNSQGYKEMGNDGFGYFTDKKLLKDTLREKRLSSTTVIALEYDEDSYKVTDISSIFRQELDEK